MNKTINSSGKEIFDGATDETPFDVDLFHEVDMSWQSEKFDPDQQWALHTNLGSLTVLDRMTGFGYRDVETGYREPNGDFWLASGQYDVRISGAKTMGEAIKWVKERANNCIPKRDQL